MSRMARRTFLEASLASLPGWSAASAFAGQAGEEQTVAGQSVRMKLPVAGITTSFGNASHADVIFSKITDGWQQDGGAGPDLRLTSLYVDQPDERDLSHALVERHNTRRCTSIEEALTLGGQELAVSGVLIVGEHGKYPKHAVTGQTMYPRREFFDAVVKVFERTGRVVPVFSDKHLSWNDENARHMVETARRMQFPLLAGSSLPVSWRVPDLTLPRECRIEEALVIGYGGLESYGFHAVEGLQALVEGRRGGECGVARVETVTGDRIWQTAREGRWSRALFDAALQIAPRFRSGDPEQLLRSGAAWYLIEYRDGLRATIAMANGVTDKYAFAARLTGQPEPVATWLALQEGFPTLHFANQLKAIEHMMHTGRMPWPVERTLLTTGILNAALLSLARGAPIDTPHLNVNYQAAHWPHASGAPPVPVRRDMGTRPRIPAKR